MGYKRPMPHQAGATSGYAIEKYKHVYLPITAFGGYYAAANASDQADIAAEDAWISAAYGSASPGEITDSGMTALAINAAGDAVNLWWAIPYDVDIKSDIQFRVHWASSSTTATDANTWLVKYKELTPDTTQVDGTDAADYTGLSTAIASDTDVATKDAYMITEWGTLDGGTLTNGRVLQLYVELDATDAAEAIYAIMLEIRYVRRAL